MGCKEQLVVSKKAVPYIDNGLLIRICEKNGAPSPIERKVYTDAVSGYLKDTYGI